MNKKLKSFLADDTIFTAMLLLLVGVISFGLGQQSSKVSNDVAPATQSAGVILIDPPLETTSQNDNTFNVNDQTISNTSVLVIGSRSGTKYHLPNCPGAKQIKETNKIFFSSTGEARAAGYTPAGNCKGL